MASSIPHIAVFPSAEMGHLIPMLRVTAMIASATNVTVTVFTALPTVSAAESDHMSAFFATHPHINRRDYQVLPYEPPGKIDPFFAQFQAISRSVRLVGPLLSSLSPPVSAIFSDITLAGSIAPFAAQLSVPYYIVMVTCAKFFSFMCHLPQLDLEKFDRNRVSAIEIPDFPSIPVSIIPPIALIPDHFFPNQIKSDVQSVSKASGVILNSFDWYEHETISAFRAANMKGTFPVLYPIGPYIPYETMGRGCNSSSSYFSWLDDQPEGSVVYVGFGSRSAMSREQIKELGEALLRSKQRFLWVLKTSVVDRDDKTGLEDILGESYLEKIKNQGMIVKQFVDQDAILTHPSTGGFVSHAGANTMMENTRFGVPMLAWPQGGDQMAAAEAGMKAGLCLWDRGWGWPGERLIKSDEIEVKIVELMTDEKFRATVKKVKEEADKAWQNGGSSHNSFQQLLNSLKPKCNQINKDSIL